MSETKKRAPRWLTKTAWATVALVVLLVGYPLSSGPVLLLCNSGYVPDEACELIRAAYKPLLRIARLSDPLEGYLVWYLHKWLN